MELDGEPEFEEKYLASTYVLHPLKIALFLFQGDRDTGCGVSTRVNLELME